MVHFQLQIHNVSESVSAKGVKMAKSKKTAKKHVRSKTQNNHHLIIWILVFVCHAKKRKSEQVMDPTPIIQMERKAI